MIRWIMNRTGHSFPVNFILTLRLYCQRLGNNTWLHFCKTDLYYICFGGICFTRISPILCGKIFYFPCFQLALKTRLFRGSSSNNMLSVSLKEIDLSFPCQFSDLVYKSHRSFLSRNSTIIFLLSPLSLAIFCFLFSYSNYCYQRPQWTPATAAF